LGYVYGPVPSWRKVTTVYKATRSIIAPLNLTETIRRRPG